MEALYCTAAPFVNYFSIKAQPHAFSSQEVSLLDSRKNKTYSNRSLTLCCYSSSAASAVSSSSLAPSSSSSPASSGNRFWVVHMRKPPQGMNSKAEIVGYYVETLEKVLGSLRDAQMSIYGSSTYNHFWFCCDIDEEASRELARLPGVLSVRPDPDYNSIFTNQMGVPLFSPGTTKHWMVRLNKPGVGIVTKAQMADHCVKLLTKVLGNESDAQMCIYHISWQSGFGFCCELDDEAAKELAGVPGVLAISPDRNFESQNKDYGGKDLQVNTFTPDSSKQTPIKTKKLFVTGLSFYTSEKTLRAAFEGFGELVGVKIIMDKISKRSKGYAFVEYTTEESASSALKEMNGKIINGWMIVVDVAKPSKHSTRQHIRQV